MHFCTHELAKSKIWYFGGNQQSDFCSLLSSKPLAAASTKKIFQVIFIILASYFFYRGVSLAQSLAQAGFFEARRARLEVLELQDAELPSSSALISSWGLLLNGCEIDSYSGPNQGMKQLRSNSTFVLELDSSFQANGYYFVTSENSTRFDPIRWSLYTTRSLNDNEGWTAVGASAWRIRFGGDNYLYPQLPFDTPHQRLYKVRIDHRPSWTTIFGAFAGSFEWSAGLLIISLAGLLKREKFVPRIFTLCSSLDVVAIATAAIGCHWTNDIRGACSNWILMVAPGILALGARNFERQIINVFVMYGLVHGLAVMLIDCVVYSGLWATVWFDILPSETTAILSFAVVVLYLRKRALNKARSVVLCDMARYNAMWQQILASHEALRELAELEAECFAFLCKCPCSTRPRQLNHRCSALEQVAKSFLLSKLQQLMWKVKTNSGKGSVPSKLDPRNPVRSLDQLYTQAMCLHPILLSKVKSWASACNGLFPISGATFPRKYVTSQDIASSPTLDVKFARVKSVHRAVEKIERSYAQVCAFPLDIFWSQCIFGLT